MKIDASSWSMKTLHPRNTASEQTQRWFEESSTIEMRVEDRNKLCSDVKYTEPLQITETMAGTGLTSHHCTCTQENSKTRQRHFARRNLWEAMRQQRLMLLLFLILTAYSPIVCSLSDQTTTSWEQFMENDARENSTNTTTEVEETTMSWMRFMENDARENSTNTTTEVEEETTMSWMRFMEVDAEENYMEHQRLKREAEGSGSGSGDDTTTPAVPTTTEIQTTSSEETTDETGSGTIPDITTQPYETTDTETSFATGSGTFPDTTTPLGTTDTETSFTTVVSTEATTSMEPSSETSSPDTTTQPFEPTDVYTSTDVTTGTVSSEETGSGTSPDSTTQPFESTGTETGFTTDVTATESVTDTADTGSGFESTTGDITTMPPDVTTDFTSPDTGTFADVTAPPDVTTEFTSPDTGTSADVTPSLLPDSSTAIPTEPTSVTEASTTASASTTEPATETTSETDSTFVPVDTTTGPEGTATSIFVTSTATSEMETDSTPTPPEVTPGASDVMTSTSEEVTSTAEFTEVTTEQATTGTSPATTAEVSTAQTTTPQGDCSVNQDLCEGNEFCFADQNENKCNCQPGYFDIGTECIPVKQFGGKLHIDDEFDEELLDEESDAYTDAVKTYMPLLVNIYAGESYYVNVTIIDFEEGSITVNYLLSTVNDTNITDETIKETFQKFLKNETVFPTGCNCSTYTCNTTTEIHILAYESCRDAGNATDVVCGTDVALQFCDSETTTCTAESDGTLTCVCQAGFDPYSSRICIAPVCKTDSACNAPFGSCEETNTGLGKCSCMWGFYGDHCERPWLFALVLVLSGMVLIFIIALVIFLCRRRKRLKSWKKANDYYDDMIRTNAGVNNKRAKKKSSQWDEIEGVVAKSYKRMDEDQPYGNVFLSNPYAESPTNYSTKPASDIAENKEQITLKTFSSNSHDNGAFTNHENETQHTNAAGEEGNHQTHPEEDTYAQVTKKSTV